MRSLVVCAVLAVLVGAVVAVPWLGLFAGEPASPPGEPSAPDPAPGAGQGPAAPGAAPAAGEPGTGLVATRLAPPPPTVDGDLAAAPTACLRVVDLASGQAVAGAPIRRVQGGQDLAFTDDRGLAAVPLREPAQLAVVVDGYLLRRVPARLGTSEAEPQLVQLVRDEWSLVRRCEFVADGARVDEAFVRFRPLPPTKKAPSPVPADDAVRARAWEEHTMLASLPVCADVPVQLGSFNEQRVHRLANGAEVRFLAAGTFLVEAATPSGLVGRAEVRIDDAPRTGAPPLRLALAPGAFVAGAVVGLTSAAPLAGATLTLQGGEPLGLVATTAADGSFRFGPVPAGSLTLHVRHGDHEPLAFGPLTAPATALRIPLAPLPATTLRGRVRARPHGLPLGGATVLWSPAGGAPVTAVTGVDGTFLLRATGQADARLAVQAAGYLPYAELVAPGTPFADYDLWPATTSERLAGGLSALLAGIVVDASGQPVVGAEVRWHPEQPAGPAGVPARRALEGASLELPLAARTGPDGAFQLETNAFGRGRLALAGTPPERGLDVVATAGKTTQGLRLP